MLAIDVSHFSQCVGGCHTWWYKKVDTRRKNTKWALVERRKKCEDIKQEKLAKQRNCSTATQHPATKKNYFTSILLKIYWKNQGGKMVNIYIYNFITSRGSKRQHKNF